MKRLFNLFSLSIVFVLLLSTVGTALAATIFRPVPVPVPSGWVDGQFNSVWGSSANDIYAVGDAFYGVEVIPLIYHCDGSSWTDASPALPSEWMSGSLAGVWGSGAEDVYAVGDGSNGEAILPLVYHYDGSTWTEVSPALPSGWDAVYLSGVWGSGVDEVYAVGYGYNGGSPFPLIYRYDGSSWTEASPALPGGWMNGSLAGVWGSGADNVYAVGYGYNGRSILPLVYHYDGSTWTEISPALPGGWSGGGLTGVWGASANNVYAVGNGNSGMYTPSLPLIYHYDGSTWTETSPDLPSGLTNGYFTGVWGSSADDVYAVGDGNSGLATPILPLVYHYDGSTWTEISPDLPSGLTNGYFHGVWGSSADDVYLAGAGASTVVSTPLFYASDSDPVLSVVSIVRAGVTPSSSAAVDFTVTFSEAVTGVDPSDFGITSTGVTGVTVSNVSGSGAVYIVTVNTGSGNGTIRLDVLATATINDLTANSLTGLPFSSGERYSILRTASFSDVDSSNWAAVSIERLYASGITSGCSLNPVSFCPEALVTRAQMAVFLLRSRYGSDYTPPAVGASTGFGDVDPSHWAAAWIKQLAAEGITGGCGSGIYCPEAPVTRAQMAVFLLKAKYGSSYAPPVVGASTSFADVQTTHWAAAWIKQLAAEGITGGCGTGTYCPGSPVTRAQMAVFLVRTFSLP